MMSITDFLAATDINPASFKAKYNVGLKATWTMVIITTNVPIDQWYPGNAAIDSQRAAIRSRISRVIEFTSSDPTLKLRAARLAKGKPLKIVPNEERPKFAQFQPGDILIPWDTLPAYSETTLVIDIAVLPKHPPTRPHSPTA